jgi:cytochrome oxidase Cu insertion factor (SCO1/SenC/PrrC family)
MTSGLPVEDMRTDWRARLLALVFLSTCGLAAAAQDIYRPTGQWRDDSGRPFKLESLYGTPTVITMAYGACRRVCSTSLRLMEQVQALADARHVRLNFVVVGLDPQADQPADWAAYRADRQLTRPNWQFLSGDEASTRQLAHRLGVRYWRYGEHTLHDLRIVLLSEAAQPLRRIASFDDSLDTLLP